MLKKLLEKILGIFAKKILDKYQPQVVAITGSVGKTTTREAIFKVLSSVYQTRTNYKNYNNEIGIPLTIIGSESGGHSLVGWLKVFFKAVGLLVFKNNNYPKMLVLEMGADHPGDIKYLSKLVPVKVGVVTAVAEVHLEFFDNLDNIAKEKGVLIRSLPKDGFAVLNFDDRRVKALAEKTAAKVISYGFAPGADITAGEIAVSHDANYQDVSTIQGVSFKLKYNGSTVPVLLPQVLGEHLVSAALAAVAVGLVYDINLHTITEALKTFEPPKGRMHLINGIKGTLIIDDTYNASPLATRKALYQLGQINLNNYHHKYAILGDMLELGSITEQAHQEIGEAVVDYDIDYLITVGEKSRDIVRGAVAKGMPEDHCFNFPDSVEAGKFAQQRIKAGDLILVKGSQGMRMEKIVKELMAEPDKAAELLVRQDASWLK
ncbi:MAG: UDP-N-acetylmuramoyl-tripeptide--D-alanyl-D-alanine ligase [Patescibacteria group bacterium]|nr:UDP-N-acetylmuramoyl-tripeptide--D-alanyl-D-alanine ligase [Patescibacteria group bacterium]